MKFHYLTLAATFALALLSGCNGSRFNVDQVDTQAMINYQPPPQPYTQEGRTYASGENLEESYSSGRTSEVKAVEPPMYSEKSSFDGAD